MAAVLQATSYDISAAEATLFEMLASGPQSGCTQTAVHAASPLGGRAAGEAEGIQPQEDVFMQNRHEALRLTRHWHKLVHRSAAAFRNGDHNAARQLAGDARRIR